MVLLCVSLSYQRTPVGVLESFTFADVSQALLRLKKVPGVEECAILQTCHRVELYAYGDAGPRPDQLLRFITPPGSYGPRPDEYATIYTDDDAIRHLFRVAAGLDSLILGENEVLHQVSSAYRLAKLTAAAGSFLSPIFESAIRAAKKVRRDTPISRGSLSMGSLAVKAARDRLGSLNGKNFTIVGAGKIGSLIAKSVANEQIRAVVIANRTYSRAKKIAKSLGGRAVRFDALEEVLAASDVVVCATAAPHKVLTKDRLERSVSMGMRTRPLLIIDVSNPRGVEPAVRFMDGVELLDLDDLAALARQNYHLKEEAVLGAEEIIEDNIRVLLQRLQASPHTSIISDFMKWAERKRWKNLEQALGAGGFNEIQEEIVRNLSYSIMRDITVPFVQSIRTQNPAEPYLNVIKGIVEGEPLR